MRRAQSKAKGLKRGGRARSAATQPDASAAAHAKKRAVKERGLVKETHPEAPTNRDEAIASLKGELAAAHRRETVTADVLKLISRSTPDLQTVLSTLVESAAQLCEADLATLSRPKGESFEQIAWYGYPPEHADFVKAHPIIPSGRGTVSGRTMLEGKVVHILDIQADPEHTRDSHIRQLDALMSVRTMLGVPLVREGAMIGVFALQRKTVRPFTQKQIELVTTFADQAVIAIENARLFDEVQARTKELTESLEQQTATSEVLQIISSSPGELQPVFQAMLENATRICEANFGNLCVRERDEFRLAASHNTPAAFIEARATLSRRASIAGPNTPVDRMMQTKSAVHVTDLASEPSYLEGHPIIVAGVELAGIRTEVIVPLLKDGDVVGYFAIYRQEVRAFTDKQIELVSNFARQAVIAIENARLLKELRQRTADLTESLEQQTATSEVLKIISRSPGELEPVFKAMLENATRICEANFGVLNLYEDGALRMGAMHNAPRAFAEFLQGQRDGYQPMDGSLLDRVVRTRQVMSSADNSAEAASRATVLGSARSIVCVPMLKEDVLVGTFTIYSQEVRPFTEKQIELVKNFAAQAVIAIENTRLLNELRESLERQTATSGVLQVISRSPSNLAPVFEAMLANATRICDAKFGNIYRWDGEALHLIASHNVPPAYAEIRAKNPPGPGVDSPTARTIVTKSVTHVVDVAAEQGYADRVPIFVEAVEVGGIRTLLSVPMLRENELIGAFTIYRQEVRPFAEKQIELVTNFARQAVIAIENARLLNELRDRTDELARSVEELRALGDVSQAVNSTLDLATVLSTIVSRAVQLSGTEAGTIYEFDEQRKELLLRSTYGMSSELIEAIRDQHLGIGEPIMDRAVARRDAVQIEDLLATPPTRAQDIIIRVGFRALLVVPLLGRDHVIGVLVVRRKAPGAFPQNTVDLLKTFAAQSVLAIQNAHLFTEIDEKSRQLEIASQHKSQFLANMSHELRTPLNAILGYTELILDNIYGETPDKMREVLERLHANGKHLLGLINDVLDLSKIEAGQLTLDLAAYSLQDVVHTVVVAVESLANGKKLSLTTVVGLDLPVGHGDERRLAQVLLNLVGNAIKFTDKGEVAIKATAGDGSFTVAVRDTGPGISPSDQGKIFEEFQQADSSITRKKGGTGLGLSIAKRIIGMHGGRIWVESDIGKGSTFAFTIPVKVERQVVEP